MKIIKDLGLAATSIFGLFIAVFIGIGLVSKEVERRSIYSLLSKPIERYQLVLGKYLGLVLTLAVNVAVMAVALYAVLAYMAWMRRSGARPAWEAPALDPALLKAIALIFVELALVTAIALFFSTFSTPMLSAALTFGLFVAGHFSADLRNFNEVVDSPAAATLARGPVLGAAEPRAVRRARAGRARPARDRWLPRAHQRLRRCSTSRRCSLRPWRSSRGATSSEWPARPSRARSAAVVVVVLLTGVGAQPCRPRASARYPRAADGRQTALYLTSGTAVRRLTVGYTRARGRPLLDSRHPVLRRHQAELTGPHRAPPPPRRRPTGTRTRCSTRCST